MHKDNKYLFGCIPFNRSLINEDHSLVTFLPHFSPEMIVESVDRHKCLDFCKFFKCKKSKSKK